MFHKLSIRILCFYSLLFIARSKVAVRKNALGHVGKRDVPIFNSLLQRTVQRALRGNKGRRVGEEECWITLDSNKHFEAMEEIEDSCQNIKEQYIAQVTRETTKFDNDTIALMLATRARREGKGVIYEEIPAGLNLGGYSMFRMPKSVLFFHRMKLRNSTRFIIYSLVTDLEKMTMTAELNLQDLHLMGSYERAVQGKNGAELKYVPTFGMAEILLKNVKYKVEGRLRFLRDSPYIILVASTLKFDRAMLVYRNEDGNKDCDNNIDLQSENIEDFIDRMKADLDLWLKDFFNHLLVFFKPRASQIASQYRECEKKKMFVRNEYVERTIMHLKKKLHDINATVVKLPSFNIVGIKGLEITLTDGWLRGLDSLYRRSVATGTHNGKIRTVDSVVGYSNLKVTYNYLIQGASDAPPLRGLFTLTADELTAQMYITLIKDVATVDITFDSIRQTREETLNMDGSANRMISNFKHILEQHVISIMSNILVHNIRLMRTLAKCEPVFIGYNYDDIDVDIDNPDGPVDGDYIIKKEDSVELEIDPKNNGTSGKYHMKLEEMLRIKKIN